MVSGRAIFVTTFSCGRLVGYSEVGKPSHRLCVGIACRISEGTQIRKGGNLTCGRSAVGQESTRFSLSLLIGSVPGFPLRIVSEVRTTAHQSDVLSFGREMCPLELAVRQLCATFQVHVFPTRYYGFRVILHRTAVASHPTPTCVEILLITNGYPVALSRAYSLAGSQVRSMPPQNWIS